MLASGGRKSRASSFNARVSISQSVQSSHDLLKRLMGHPFLVEYEARNRADCLKKIIEHVSANGRDVELARHHGIPVKDYESEQGGTCVNGVNLSQELHGNLMDSSLISNTLLKLDGYGGATPSQYELLGGASSANSNMVTVHGAGAGAGQLKNTNKGGGGPSKGMGKRVSMPQAPGSYERKGIGKGTVNLGGKPGGKALAKI